MKTKEIVIDNIFDINKFSLQNKNIPNSIYYLDTSSIIRNIINKEQNLNRDIKEYPSRAKRIVKKNTILYSTVRPNLEHFGYIDESKKNLIASTGYVTLNIKENIRDISPKFVYYYLTQPHITYHLHRIASNSVTSYPSINPDDLGGLKFKIPRDINYQNKIALFLYAIENKIKTNVKINKKLEEITKLIYKFWFLQFNFPNTEGKPYMINNGKMYFNDKLKNELPVGWDYGKIKDYSKLNGGYAFKSSSWIEDGLKVIRIKNINDDYTVSTHNCSSVSKKEFSNLREFEVKYGDVVIALTGATVGKYGIIPKDQDKILINQRVGFFDLGKKPMDKLPFLINSLNQKYFRKTIYNISNGSDQDNISTDEIEEIPLILPTIEIIDQYNELCKPYFKTIINNQSINQQLINYFNWVAPRLINGEFKLI
ncbi:restriction endonuclease subunit S [Pelagibacteraceae bacterium]|nr:restriction endonuclease subunit S [Pelagibacteraceae bacterium]